MRPWFWVSIALAVLILLAGLGLGHLVGHRPVHHVPAPVVTTSVLFAERDEPEPDWAATLPDSQWWNADLRIPRAAPLGGGS